MKTCFWQIAEKTDALVFLSVLVDHHPSCQSHLLQQQGTVITLELQAGKSRDLNDANVAVQLTKQ